VIVIVIMLCAVTPRRASGSQAEMLDVKDGLFEQVGDVRVVQRMTTLRLLRRQPEDGAGCVMGDGRRLHLHGSRGSFTAQAPCRSRPGCGRDSR
jgi:hypothetical protein